MNKKRMIALLCAVAISGCSPNLAGSPVAPYDNYNCQQIGEEREALTDQIANAESKQNSHTIFQLGMAAFALSNGQNYNTTADSSDVDHLNAQFDELRHEAIRKNCRWRTAPPL